jgi:transcription elongation factor Elf1
MKLLSRYDNIETRNGIQHTRNQCPRCRLLNQNFLVVDHDETPLLSCLQCGLVFVPVEYLRGPVNDEVQDMVMGQQKQVVKRHRQMQEDLDEDADKEPDTVEEEESAELRARTCQ